MESVDLQMEDIFGDGEEDTLFDNRASIPDLPPDDVFQAEGGDGDEQNIENDAVLARLRDLSKGAAKRTVKRVQPKLDPIRLTGERGIGILPAVFKDVKFQGKGHEADDLKKIMRYLEHWAHRLFPKMPFDEVLDRIEKLGTKREVQTYIKRMRMDIPIQPEENTEENQDPLSTSVDGAERMTNIGDDKDEEEVLDEIFREQNEKIQQSQSSQSATSVNTLTNQTAATQSSQPNTSMAASTPSGLTTEQLERIEANKLCAHERRMAKLGLSTPGTPSLTQPQTSVVNTPLAYPSSPTTHLPVDTAKEVMSASPLVVTSGVEGGNSNQDTPKANLDFDELTEDQLLADLDCDSIINSKEKDVTVSTSNQSVTTAEVSESTNLNSLPSSSTSDISNSLPSTQTASSAQDNN